MMFGFTSRARKEIAANIAALEQAVAAFMDEREDRAVDSLREEAELELLHLENDELHHANAALRAELATTYVRGKGGRIEHHPSYVAPASADQVPA